MGDLEISKHTLSRLPMYLRVIDENQDMEFISASFIANQLGLHQIQVRKDLALVSTSDGKPGFGFNTKSIKKELEDFLGLNNKENAVIVGAGKLGLALYNYAGFKNNLNILKAFDADDSKCNGSTILGINQLADFIKNMKIKIGIITVPKDSAQEVCDIMINSGIKVIWNFAPANLIVPEDIILKNEDLMSSMSILLNKLKSVTDK